MARKRLATNHGCSLAIIISWHGSLVNERASMASIGYHFHQFPMHFPFWKWHVKQPPGRLSPNFGWSNPPKKYLACYHRFWFLIPIYIRILVRLKIMLVGSILVLIATIIPPIHIDPAFSRLLEDSCALKIGQVASSFRVYVNLREGMITHTQSHKYVYIYIII